MLNKIIVGSFLASVLFITGCATATNSGFLSGYDRLQRGRYVEKYWYDPESNQHTISPIYIDAVDTSQITDRTNVTRAEASGWLRVATASAIKGQSHWQVAQQPESSASRLVLAITYLTPGNAGDRIFAGEFGLGHAFVQVEGKLTEPNSGKEIACFAERRRDSGAAGLADLSGDAGAKLVKRMLERIASDSVREIFATLK